MISNKIFLVIAALFFLACSGNEIDLVNKYASNQKYPIETGKNVEIIYTDSGLQKAIVKAPILERFAGPDANYTEMKRGIDVKFLNKNGQVESFLTSKYAIRYDRDKKMVAKNDVVVLNLDGDTLRTEELFWDESLQKVSSQKFVKITTHDEIIMGDGFESDISFKNPKIYKIRGVVSLK